MPRNDGVSFTCYSFKIPLSSLSQTLASHFTRARHSAFQLIHSLRNHSNFVKNDSTRPVFGIQSLIKTSPVLCFSSLSITNHNIGVSKSPLLCSASLSLSQPASSDSTQSGLELVPKGQSATAGRYDEERILISEVLVWNKDGEELERKDLETEAITALKASSVCLIVKKASSDHFRSTSGEKGKFGLTTIQILRVVKKLRDSSMLDCLQLLHFHIGSQIPSTNLLQAGVGEAAQIYSELVRLGADMKVIDIGGGLGIDYDGSKSVKGRSIGSSEMKQACLYMRSKVMVVTGGTIWGCSLVGLTRSHSVDSTTSLVAQVSLVCRRVMVLIALRLRVQCLVRHVGMFSE